MTATSSAVPRTVSKAILAVEQSEGQGARVRRSIGTPALRNLTPFLMLDHFSIKPGAGFPDQYVSFFFSLYSFLKKLLQKTHFFPQVDC